MTFGYRFLVTIGCSIIGSFWLVHQAFVETQAIYDAGDHSAFAWTGFLPFIYPVFLIESAAVFLSVWAVFELILMVTKHLRKKSQ